MFFNTSDEDDGSGFTVGMPPSGSKLQSLFGGDQSSPTSGNESLMYVPPKQPKAKNEGAQQSVEQKAEGPSLMYACACHTFRYANGQYVNQGKLGVAVLGNFATKDYKLLIYASQKKAVTSSKIHPTFVFQVQKDNYASFYDDQSQNWSIRFDSEEHLFEAAKRVAIAKFNITPAAVISQDLNCHATQEIQKGDTVEVQYTGWLHDGNNFGKVFDSNETTGRLLKFKVGKGKVIKGWDLGILGMKKLSKRLIIVPPDLASESKDIGPKIPPNCALIFQVEITRVKFVNPQQDSDTVSLSGQIESEKSNINDDMRETDISTSNESLSVRTKSISEQLSKPESSKSKLLERMSKMGKSMVAPSNVSNVSVEDEIDEDDSRKFKSKPAEQMSENLKPQLKPKPDSPRPVVLPLPGSLSDVHVPLSQPAPQSNLIYQQPTIDPNSMYHAQQQQQQQQQQHQQHHQQQQQQLALYQSPHSVQATLFGYPSVPQIAVPQVTSQPASMSSTEMNLMLTDGRLKHTEIKTDLNRIVDKIDGISSKINNLESTNKQLQITQAMTPQPQMFNQGPEMEASVIMQNITRIIKENEKLRTECEEKTKKIELLNERMTDLLTKNQQFFEKSNQLLANQTDSMQNSATQAMVKVSHLEDQNIRLQTELAALRSQLVQSHGQKDVISKNEGHLSNKIDTLTQELMHVKESADVANSLTVAKEAIIADLQEQLKNGKTEQKQIQSKFAQLQEDNAELKTEKESLNKILNDLKKKRKSEKEKNDEELEELKSQHEEEIKSLRERYKKSSGNESEKIAKVEEELTQQYEEKMKTKIKLLEKTHKEALNKADEENDVLREDMKKMKDKLSNLAKEHTKNLSMELEGMKKKMTNEHSHAMNELNERNELLVTKLEAAEKKSSEQPSSQQQEQYSNLLQKFDKQVQEIDKWKSDCDNAYDKGLKDGRSTVQTISTASYQKGYSEGKADVETRKESELAPSPSASVSREKIAEEVKKVMNTVFFKTKTEFQAGKKYDGKHVVTTLLSTIKEITLKMVANADANEESDDSDELSEDEESDDDDEEEDEEEVEESYVYEDRLELIGRSKDSGEKGDNEDNTGESTVQIKDVKEESTKFSEEPRAQIAEVSEVESVNTSEGMVNADKMTKPDSQIDAVSQIEAADTQLDANENPTSKVSEELHNDLSKEINSIYSEPTKIEVDVEPPVFMETDSIKSNPVSSVSTEPSSSIGVEEITAIHPCSTKIHANLEPSVSIETDSIDNLVPSVTTKTTASNDVQELTFEATEIDDNLVSFISIEPTVFNDALASEFNPSMSFTGKSSVGTSGDESYATDEGEVFDEKIIAGTKDTTQPKKIKSVLISDLLDVVENNQKPFQSKVIDDEGIPKENGADTGNIENYSDDYRATHESNQTMSSSNILHEEVKNELLNEDMDLPIESNNTESITKVIDLPSQENSIGDQPENATQSDSFKLGHEGPLVSAKNDSTTKSGSLDTNSKIVDKSGDELNNGVSDVVIKKKRNTLEDLGLDSSMFDVTKPESDCTLLNEDSKGNGIAVSSESALISSKETSKPPTSKEEDTSAKKSSIKSSIFDEEDSDDGDLFNPSVKHRVSPFVRSPPPLFDDDDDDVNWI